MDPNSAWVVAVVGFLGTLAGAVAGGRSSLAATRLSLEEARRQQREHWERETAEARLSTLKEAYVEYFTAFQRLHSQMVESHAVASGKNKDDPRAEQAALELGKAWREHMPMMGTKLRLLETSREAKEKSARLLEAMSLAVANSTFGEDSFFEKVKLLNEPLQKVAEFELWVADVRFAPGYVDKPPAAGRALEP